MDTELNIAEWIENVQRQLENPQPDFPALEYLRLAWPVIEALNTTHASSKQFDKVTLRFKSASDATRFLETFNAFDNPTTEGQATQ